MSHKGELKMSKHALVIDHSSYKVGVDEIAGLKAIMVKLMTPVKEVISEHVHWSDVELQEAEYKSRDGFIAYNSNCGGIQIVEVIPKCEESSFDYLGFGECDDCNELSEEALHENALQCGYNGQECSGDSEGHLDAAIRIWLKFEGINSENEMEFYLVLSGGNEDAPYFRVKYLPTLFETSFKCKTLKQLEKIGAKEIAKLLKVIS